jgi:hypothetical protein
MLGAVSYGSYHNLDLASAAFIGADSPWQPLTSQEMMDFRARTRHQIHFEAFALHTSLPITTASIVTEYSSNTTSRSSQHKPQTLARLFLLTNSKLSSTSLRSFFLFQFQTLHVRVFPKLKFSFTIMWQTLSREVFDNGTASVVKRSEFLATDPDVRVRFPALPDFPRCSGSGTGCTQTREYNWGATWKKN